MTKANDSKPFQRLYAEITNICNWHCSFCPKSPRKFEEMPLERFKKLVVLARPLFEEMTFHVLGEPLLHSRFPDLLKCLEQEEMKLFLVTNGSQITKYQDELLNFSFLKQINFSLHGLTEREQEIDKRLKEVFSFCQKLSSQKPEVYINLRLWNLNKDENSKDLQQKVLSLIEKTFGVSLNPNVEIRLGKGKRIKDRIYLHQDTPFHWPSLDDKYLGNQIHCYGFHTQMAVLSDGAVVPCCLDYLGVNKLGSFEEIFPKLVELKQDASQVLNNSSLCQRCTFSRQRVKGESQ